MKTILLPACFCSPGLTRPKVKCLISLVVRYQSGSICTSLFTFRYNGAIWTVKYTYNKKGTCTGTNCWLGSISDHIYY